MFLAEARVGRDAVLTQAGARCAPRTTSSTSRSRCSQEQALAQMASDGVVEAL